MDPLSHVVIGRSLTAALPDDRRLGPGAGAAVVLGALAPDVDAVFVPSGWDIYLRAHEIGTHSIAGALLVACATAGFVRVCSRQSRYVPLAGAAAAGVMSHIALDVLSGARIRVAWPFADARVSVPLVAMADPWLIAICVTGLAAALLAGHRVRTVARVVLVAATGLLCVKAALLDRVLRQSDAAARQHADIGPAMPAALSAVEARWGSFTEWFVFDRTPGEVREWRVATRAPAALVLSHAIDAESPLVTASRSLDTVRNFLRTHDFGFAVETPGAERTRVLWSDLRYCQPAAAPERPIVCALWFGGSYTTDGRLVTQEVTVGSWHQTRAGPP